MNANIRGVMSNRLRTALVAGAVLSAGLLSGCWERPPIDTKQHGYRGTAMVMVANPRTEAALAAAPSSQVPDAQPKIPAAGTLAKATYKNVQVLGELDTNEFTRTMLAMTAWVAPTQGCNYCHAPGEDLSSDKLYTKVVARKMLQMTRKVNADWKTHVASTGVTCYTCHRGNPVPAYVWYHEAGQAEGKAHAGWRNGQNRPGATVGLASLPVDPFTPYLEQATAIRVEGTQALPVGNGMSIQHTEQTYALMTHMSKALGVNCTYCHNTQSFTDWTHSTPQRVTAWYGIRMARSLNVDYIGTLQTVFPAERLGPNGDVAKANCQTCHQGVYKPLGGAAMAKDYPALMGTPSAPDDAASAQDRLARVLFAVGKADLDAPAQDAIGAAAKSLQGDAALKVDLSGFADKTGSPDQNLELAKMRAFAVRDALKAAGVAEERINLRKPEFVIGGAEAESRRVDILAAH